MPICAGYIFKLFGHCLMNFSPISEMPINGDCILGAMITHKTIVDFVV